MKATEKMLLTAVLAGGVLAAVVLCTFILSEDEAGILPGSDPETAIPVGESETGEITSDISDILESEDEVTAREIVEVESDAPLDGSEDGSEATGSGVLTGRIIDEYNNPVEGAGITFRKGNSGFDFYMFDMNSSSKKKAPEKPNCTSGGNGRFILEKAAEMDNPVLHVYHPNYVPVNYKFNYFDGVSKEVEDIRLEVGGSVSGYVTAPSGNPIEGVRVQASASMKQQSSMFVFIPMGSSHPEWGMETGPDGHYRIKGLPAGEVTITGFHEDFTPVCLKDVMIQKGRETPKTDLVLTRGQIIAGTVLDEDDKPVAGAKVRADRDFVFNMGPDKELDPTMFMRGKLEAETDEKGAFTLKALKKGTYTIRVELKGYVSERVRDVKAGTLDLACILSRGGRLYGRVVDARSEKGIEKFDIKVQTSRGGSQKVRVLMGKEALEKRPELGDPLGAYFIDGIKAGAYTVKITAENYGDGRVTDLTAVIGKETERILKLWPESTVSGMVHAPSGGPLADARVRIQRPRKKSNSGQFDTVMLERMGDLGYVGDSWSPNRWDNWSRQAKSKEDGTFLIRGIPDGDFELKASHTDHLETEPLALTLQKGEKRQNLSLTLGAAGSIAGTAFDMDGKPEPRARLSAVKIGEHGMATGRTKKVTAEDDGKYSIHGLAPGNYRVRHTESQDEAGMLFGAVNFYTDSGDGGPAEKGLVLVEAGNVSFHDVYRISKCSIEGVVTEAGRPVEGMNVKLFKSGNRFGFDFMPLKTAATDAFGAYSIADVEPGKYRVKLEISGLPVKVEEEVELVAGGMERVNFALPTGRISGRILNDQTGDPAVGVRVTLSKAPKEGEGGDEKASNQISFMSYSTDGSSMISMGGPAQPVKTDENGYYLFRFVPDGDYKLTASGGGYVKGDMSPITVTAGRETANQNLKLIRGLTISGKVIEAATGKPFTKYLPITCMKIKEGKESEAITVSSSGERGFTFPELLPGNYRILAKEGSKYSGSIDITLKDQDVTDLELVVK